MSKKFTRSRKHSKRANIKKPKKTSTISPKTLRKQRIKEIVEMSAINHFGLTDNLLEAGFILEDGTLLDFGSSKVNPRYNPRRDHTEIGFVIPDELRDTSINKTVQFSILTNAIRIFPNRRRSGKVDISLDLNVDTDVTVDQKNTILQYARILPGQLDVSVDIRDKTGKILDSQYVANVGEDYLKQVFQRYELLRRGKR